MSSGNIENLMSGGRFKTASDSSVGGLRKGAPANSSVGSIDWVLCGLLLILLAFGLMMVMSASGMVGLRKFNDVYYFFKRQLIFVSIGLVWVYIAANISIDFLYKLHYVLLFICIAMLVLVLSPLSEATNGASRWLNFGLASFRIQPMEFTKIALVLYLAFFLSTKQGMIKTFSRGVVPPFLITGLICVLLLLQPDFGGASVMTVLLFVMCITGGTRRIYLFLSAALAASAGTLLIIMEPYRFQRFTSFMDPFANASSSGYQLVQSFYALGSGGLSGVGLGAGRQKLFYLPEGHTDFIMSVFGEELGFIGITIIFALMALLVWRGFRTALLQPDIRSRLVCFGLTMIIAIPMVLNIAVISGSVPPKGVPMPFISYGGSSLIASMIAVGLLLNFSKRCSLPSANGDH